MTALLARLIERTGAVTQLLRDLIAVLHHNSGQLSKFLSHLDRRLTTMTQQHDAMNAKLDAIATSLGGVRTDLAALLAAISNSNSPPSAENWQDVLDKADGLQASVNDLDASVRGGITSPAPTAPPAVEGADGDQEQPQT